MAQSPGPSKSPLRQSTSANQMAPCCMIPFFGAFGVMGLVALFAFLGTSRGGPELFFLVVPIVFILIGVFGVKAGIGMIGKSPERMASEHHGPLPLPKVTLAQGQRLPVGLTAVSPPAVTGGCLLGFAIFWDVIVGVGVLGFMSSHGFQGFGSLMGLFFLPFIVIGIVLPVLAASQFMTAAGLRGTTMEVEREPVVPGERVRAILVPAGKAARATLTIDLVCQEKIAYTRGTDTYHEQNVVFEQRLAEADGTASYGGAQEQAVEFTVPAEGPCSFHAAHNDVVWMLRVKGRVPRWPDFTLEYAFRVVPQTVRERLT